LDHDVGVVGAPRVDWLAWTPRAALVDNLAAGAVKPPARDRPARARLQVEAKT
jgi:hypothetical protein